MEIVFKQEVLDEGWIELKNQISRCTVTEKINIKKRIVCQKFWWDWNALERREKLGKRMGNGGKEKVIATETSNWRENLNKCVKRNEDARRGKK